MVTWLLLNNLTYYPNIITNIISEDSHRSHLSLDTRSNPTRVPYSFCGLREDLLTITPHSEGFKRILA